MGRNGQVLSREELILRLKSKHPMSKRPKDELMGSCVQFTLSLHRHHNVPLTQAYTISTKEFAKLRGAHELATQAAEAEARAHGAIFTSDPWVSSLLFCFILSS